MAATTPSHVRLPQRAEAIAGSDQQSGEAKHTDATTDTRTATQDPSAKEHQNSDSVIAKP